MSLPDATGGGAKPKTTKPTSLFKTLDLAALNFHPAESPTNTARDQGKAGSPGNKLMLAAVSSSLSLPGFYWSGPHHLVQLV